MNNKKELFQKILKATLKLLPIITFAGVVAFSCIKKRLPTGTFSKKYSILTGLPYQEEDGFKLDFHRGQVVPPDFVYIEGGMYLMGGFDDTQAHYSNSSKKRVSLPSFFIAEAPTTNLQWRVYLGDLRKQGKLKAYDAALPDEKIWSGKLVYNDPYVNYLDHNGFSLYPVVGISYKQALAYCDWRTEKYNSMLKTLHKEEFEKEEQQMNVESQMFKNDEKVGFDEEDDEVDEEEGDEDEDDLDDEMEDDDDEDVFEEEESEEEDVSLSERREKREKRIKLTKLRNKGWALSNRILLPTEAQWEFVAKGPIGIQSKEFTQTEQRIYPWSGLSVKGKSGSYLAKFKRGQGDYAGLPGQSETVGVTTSVYDMPPNDFGVYIGSNISEFTLDTYRPIIPDGDFNPIRRDGTQDPEESYVDSNTLINNRAKVIKGASWKDGVFWLDPSKRRYIDIDATSDTVGFRCAMASTGSQSFDKQWQKRKID